MLQKRGNYIILINETTNWMKKAFQLVSSKEKHTSINFYAFCGQAYPHDL